jgi:hypothetical protein
VKANEKAIEQLKQCAKVMLVNVPDKDVEVMREGLVCHTFHVYGLRSALANQMQCFRPVTSSGRPIVSRIPDDKLGGVKTKCGASGGVFIAVLGA